MISETDAISMFLLGLLGTGHCVGMCGPLVVALPGQFGGWPAHLMYHIGRIATYSALGAVMGLVGRGVSGMAAFAGGTPLVWVARVQVGMSTVAALFLLIFGLMRLRLLPEPTWFTVATPASVPGYRRALTAVRHHRHLLGLGVVGMMMGLLPCGLSYAALARALATGSAVSGFVLVACFGVGTLPGLFVLGSGMGAFFRRYQTQTEILAALLMLFMGGRLLASAWVGV